jgi:acetyl esterase
MSIDPWYERLRAGEAELAAAVTRLEPAIRARMFPQIPADPGYISPQVSVQSDVAPGPRGDVPVRIYRPTDEAGGAARPLFVWCHGGGWVGGDLDMPEADATSREVCARSGAVVVSVDYRLAVEGVHHPAPLDDVVATWTWALGSCSTWGASADRTVLGGASAGGNLAAGAALRLRDGGQALPSALALVYPALHPGLAALTDEQRAGVGLDTSAEDLFRQALSRMMENYLGAPISAATPEVAPALGDLAGLPPTLIVTCEYDVLRFSGEDFAHLLDEASVECKLVMAPSVGHAHINAPWLPAAQQTFADLAAWVSNV